MSRILIVRLSALGDVIHGLPVLCALRDALPQAHLGWVVEGRAGDLLEGHCALDQLIRLPREWLKSPRQILALRRCLRESRFDVAIDLQSLTKSAVAAWLSAAPRRIGKAGRDGRELSKWFHNELVAPRGRHVIDHYLGLLAPLGIESPDVRFDVPQRDEDATTIDQFLRPAQIEPQAFLLINPGAGWPSKLWPAGRYGEVAQHVATAHNTPSVVVWAGEAERRLAETVVGQSQGCATLAPPTTVTELAALARQARLFLGSDTGPMHLAVAVGTPAISLHGPSRAEWCGAYGPDNMRLQVCVDDGRARHRHNTDDSAMRAISTEMVCQACDQLLASKSRLCG